MSESNQHLHTDLPIVVAGGGAGQIKGNRHVAWPRDPITNLYVTLLERLAFRSRRSATAASVRAPVGC